VKILVVRRDNIGDLVLTTPVFTALRRHFPKARIEALVNSYNAPVLEGHPDIDFLHVYTKSKHRESRWDAFSEWSERLRQAVALRSERFDHVLVPSPGFHPRQLRLARWLRPRNRWSESKFAELMRALHERMGARFRLFWAPGREDDPRHPGDDEKARRILEKTRPVPVEPVETRALGGLIKGLASCDALVCSDGGAMHLAAALGKPILCFFGDSAASHWHPWGVRYRLLQPASLDAGDIAVDEAIAAFLDLAHETELPHAA